MLAQVRDVVQLHREPAVLHLADVAGREFERPELATERHLLRVVQVLVAKDQHAVAIDRGVDGVDVIRAERPRQVDAVHDGREVRLSRRVDGFGARLPAWICGPVRSSRSSVWMAGHVPDLLAERWRAPRPPIAKILPERRRNDCPRARRPRG